MAEEAGTNIPMVPRMENIRAATPEEYHCQTITISLRTNRFNEHARKATIGLYALSCPISDEEYS